MFAIQLQQVLTDIYSGLKEIAPMVGVLLIVLAGIVYGLSATQPAEVRGRWQSTAIGMFIGGIIIAAIAGASDLIVQVASGLLKPA